MGRNFGTRSERRACRLCVYEAFPRSADGSELRSVDVDVSDSGGLPAFRSRGILPFSSYDKPYGSGNRDLPLRLLRKRDIFGSVFTAGSRRNRPDLLARSLSVQQNRKNGHGHSVGAYLEQPIIKVENVQKKYRLGVFNSGTLAGDFLAWRAKRRGEENPNIKIGQEWRLKNRSFNALSDISFTVQPGERLGIIGANGAGKSTLLKLLCRITAPSKGNIYLNGRVASLLEVGTGFTPELTGRDNIYLNGAILGMPKAVTEKKINDIIEFSDCTEFIDTPVKRYSSGMKIRLGFAVAAHLDNEITIMDEVLAVGDAAFQQKCIDKMNEISRDDGRTILYVSHMLYTVRDLCTRCIVLDHGKIIYDGEVDDAIRVYLQKSGTGVLNYSFDGLPRIYKSKGIQRGAVIHSLNFPNEERLIFKKDKPIEIDVKWESLGELNNAHFIISVRYLNGDAIGSVISESFNISRAGEYDTKLKLAFSGLKKGSYYFNIAIGEEGTLSTLVHDFPNVNISFDIEEPDNNVEWRHNRFGHLVLDEAEIIETRLLK